MNKRLGWAYVCFNVKVFRFCKLILGLEQAVYLKTRLYKYWESEGKTGKSIRQNYKYEEKCHWFCLEGIFFYFNYKEK
jgi:hypothetical protein